MSDIEENALLVLAHLAEDHSDVAMIFAADAIGHEPENAEIVGIDAAGFTIDIEGHESIRISFPETVGDLNALFALTNKLLAPARLRLGRSKPSSLEAQETENSVVPLWRTTVRRTRRVTPGTVEIVLGGGDLDHYTGGKPDGFHYVMTPPAGRDVLELPVDFAIGDLQNLVPADVPIAATYTVRRWRPEVGEIDIIVVMHDHSTLDNDSLVGNPKPTMASWAKTVEPGCPVVLWGPRSTFDPPVGTERLVLIVDDTGLPAAAAIIEATDASVAIDVIAEVATVDECVGLGSRASVLWLCRDGRPVGTSDLLQPALEQLLATRAPGPTTYLWGAAESHVVSELRRLLRHDRELPASAVSMTGYWRHAPVD